MNKKKYILKISDWRSSVCFFCTQRKARTPGNRRRSVQYRMRGLEYINLCPHRVNLHGADGERVVEPSGQVARCQTTSTLIDIVDGVEFYVTTYGSVTGLLAPRPGVLLIVSGLVKTRAELEDPSRVDLASPGALVRDEEGRVVGSRGLNVHPDFRRG